MPAPAAVPSAAPFRAALYHIPDIWLAGYLRGHPGASIADAVSHWCEQVRLDAQYQSEAAR